MTTKVKTIYFATLPKCNFCGLPAHVDAPTSRGPWAYQCTVCWPLVGNPAGLHTLLAEGDEPEEDPVAKRRSIREAIEAGDFDEAEDLIGDGDISEWL